MRVFFCLSRSLFACVLLLFASDVAAAFVAAIAAAVAAAASLLLTVAEKRRALIVWLVCRVDRLLGRLQLYWSVARLVE